MSEPIDKQAFERALAKTEDEFVDLFNQTVDCLGAETKAAHVFEDSYHIPSDELMVVFKEALHWNFNGMLVAASREEFQLYRQGLDQELSHFAELLSVPTLTGNAKVIECLRVMTELTVNLNPGYYQAHPQHLLPQMGRLFELINHTDPAEHERLIGFQVKIIALLLESDPDEFKCAQAQLVHELSEHPQFVDPNKAGIAQALNLLNTQINHVQHMRFIYLESTLNQRHTLGNFLWLSGGVLLLTATLVVTFLSLPVIGVIGLSATTIGVGIALGAGVLGYSLLDFMREMFHLNHQHINPHHHPSSVAHKVVAAVGVTAALGLGLAGLLAAIPALAMSPVIPVVMAGAALVIATGFTAKLVFQYVSTAQRLQQAKEKVTQYNDKIHSTIDDKAYHDELKETSMMKIDKQLIDDLSRGSIAARLKAIKSKPAAADPPSDQTSIRRAVPKPKATDEEDEHEGEQPPTSPHR